MDKITKFFGSKLNSTVGLNKQVKLHFALIFSVLVAMALMGYAPAKAGSLESYNESLDKFQAQIAEQQLADGEWAGINEGDPRWDVMFMTYTYGLHKFGLKFASKETLDRVIKETVSRLKNWRGFQKNGWAQHQGADVDPKLTGSILLALNHVDSKLVEREFRTQQQYWNKKGWDVGDMTVLDRAIFRMMQAPGKIILPPFVNTLVFLIRRDSHFPINIATLGYYRWGFVSVTVWKYFNDMIRMKDTRAPRKVVPVSKEVLALKGKYVDSPELAASEGPLLRGNQFWAHHGLAWLLERPHADGNPAPTLILHQALFAAHRSGAIDLSRELEEGWLYMDRLRLPMRNQVKAFQPSISPIWDTARVLSALNHIPDDLRQPKLAKKSTAIGKALNFLLAEQNKSGGDFLIANPDFKPGGWGFAYGGQKYPDSDDTAMVVDALIPHALENSKVEIALQKGIDWLLQFQNASGGFPAWDFDAVGIIQSLIDFGILPKTSLEPQLDVSARVLRALTHVNQAGVRKIDANVFQKACGFLARSPINSVHGVKLWPGTWAVNYLYGTSEVLSSMIEANCSADIDLKGYFDWIKNIQNADGGWGESSSSYVRLDYAQGESTITQTLGALQLLLTYENHRIGHPNLNLPSAMAMIEKGVEYYLKFVDARGDIHDENEKEFTACYACPGLYVRYDLIPLYMGTEVLAKFMRLKAQEKPQ